MSILVEEAQIAKILESAKTIAVVGLSSKPWRPSFGVSAYMQKQGYHIIPVNPNVGEALGESSYERLDDVPEPIDIVNIFRRSEEVGPIVDAAIRLGARCIWMQEGVVDHEAAARAEAAGLDVVVNRCILKYHRRLAR
jgi:predicted CoA-binding protein